MAFLKNYFIGLYKTPLVHWDSYHGVLCLNLYSAARRISLGLFKSNFIRQPYNCPLIIPFILFLASRLSFQGSGRGHYLEIVWRETCSAFLVAELCVQGDSHL